MDIYYLVIPLPVLLAKPYSLVTDRFFSLNRLRRRGTAPCPETSADSEQLYSV